MPHSVSRSTSRPRLAYACVCCSTNPTAKRSGLKSHPIPLIVRRLQKRHVVRHTTQCKYACLPFVDASNSRVCCKPVPRASAQSWETAAHVGVRFAVGREQQFMFTKVPHSTPGACISITKYRVQCACIAVPNAISALFSGDVRRSTAPSTILQEVLVVWWCVLLRPQQRRWRQRRFNG